jgi:hypothetical protein
LLATNNDRLSDTLLDRRRNRTKAGEPDWGPYQQNRKEKSLHHNFTSKRLFFYSSYIYCNACPEVVRSTRECVAKTLETDLKNEN